MKEFIRPTLTALALSLFFLMGSLVWTVPFMRVSPLVGWVALNFYFGTWIAVLISGLMLFNVLVLHGLSILWEKVLKAKVMDVLERVAQSRRPHG